MTFLQRNLLIEGLLARGFRPGKSEKGWNYIHKQDSISIDFNASGQFSLTTFDSVSRSTSCFGVATEPKHILDLIDTQAAEL